MRNIFQYIENSESYDASIHLDATRTSSLNWIVKGSARILNKTTEPMQEKKMYNSLKQPWVVKSIQPQGSCHVTDTQNVVMLTLTGMNIPEIHLQFDPKVEMLLKLCGKEHTILPHGRYSASTVEMGRYVCCNQSYTILVGQIHYAAG